MQDQTEARLQCGYGNRPGKRFCSGCGTALSASCLACGATNEPGARFCDECGSALSLTVSEQEATATGSAESAASPIHERTVRAVPASPSAASEEAEERRLVTALFCDLVGFTPISERLDPEEARDMQGAYFAAMSTQIDRYGGTVEKYAGDAILALFGAPLAHEDDAERAVLCALGMQAAIEAVATAARERWEVEPKIRVGVNTGEVISGTWRASGRQDVAVTGDSLNTAARIQAVAEPGEVLVGTETMRLTRRRIRYGDRRDVALKGKAGKVPVYSAQGMRERFGERWETSQSAMPFVGRDREMVELLDAWVRAQGGEGQLVTVIGDAGVGKSRIIAELLDKVGPRGDIRVIRGRCLSYGQEVSLWLIADLLRGSFDIGEQDDQNASGAKLSAALTGLLLDRRGESQAEARDVLGEVLGLHAGNSAVANAGAQIRRAVLIRSMRSIVGALAERAPTVIVLEDLHWIDEASKDVLRDLLSDVPGLRTLVLGAQRPGWTTPWSEWGWTERITLRPLRDEDAAILAGAVLEGLRLSSELERYVAERAGGNPFFVEEMLRVLQETGDLEQRNGAMYLVPGAARLPTTLTEVLLARLDRLDAGTRAVAQVASVIGRNFAVRLLGCVMEQEATVLEVRLSALQKAEIAFPRRGSDLEYVFKHVSMREVSYNTLVQKRRQQLHLLTGRAIATLYPSEEYVERKRPAPAPPTRLAASALALRSVRRNRIVVPQELADGRCRLQNGIELSVILPRTNAFAHIFEDSRPSQLGWSIGEARDDVNVQMGKARGLGVQVQAYLVRPKHLPHCLRGAPGEKTKCGGFVFRQVGEVFHVTQRLQDEPTHHWHGFDRMLEAPALILVDHAPRSFAVTLIQTAWGAFGPPPLFAHTHSL